MQRRISKSLRDTRPGRCYHCGWKLQPPGAPVVHSPTCVLNSAIEAEQLSFFRDFGKPEGTAVTKRRKK